VQQNGGLAHDPALVAGEGDAGEAVVDARIVLQRPMENKNATPKSKLINRIETG
jgi:hypothetical protein